MILLAEWQLRLLKYSQLTCAIYLMNCVELSKINQIMQRIFKLILMMK